jgi:hypothetical protein
MALVLIAVLIGGCYNKNTGAANVGSLNFTLPAFPETGSYAVEVFTEMHYQPSYGVQEVPRLLPPAGSVPVTGKELAYSTVAEYQALSVPDQVAQAYNAAKAQDLYRINCAVCHGESLQGDGRITQMTRADGTLVMNRGPFPANLMLDATKASSDGDLYAFISQGGREGLVTRLRGRASGSSMPEFRLLLTEEDRWTLVQFLRLRIGGQ